MCNAGALSSAFCLSFVADCRSACPALLVSVVPNTRATLQPFAAFAHRYGVQHIGAFLVAPDSTRLGRERPTANALGCSARRWDKTIYSAFVSYRLHKKFWHERY